MVLIEELYIESLFLLSIKKKKIFILQSFVCHGKNARARRHKADHYGQNILLC